MMRPVVLFAALLLAVCIGVISTADPQSYEARFSVVVTAKPFGAEVTAGLRPLPRGDR